MALSADGYQKDQTEVSFVCQSGLHERCAGSTVDELWKRWPCQCSCHAVRDGCAHELRIPHFFGDGSGRMRWTCGVCWADLRGQA